MTARCQWDDNGIGNDGLFNQYPFARFNISATFGPPYDRVGTRPIIFASVYGLLASY